MTSVSVNVPSSVTMVNVPSWSYDVYGLHVAHDGTKEKKPLRAEWLVHELTDAGEEV